MIRPPISDMSQMENTSNTLIDSPCPSHAEADSTSVPAKSTSGKLAFIDALRGLAALMVVACHVANIPSPSLSASPALLRLISSGKAGVLLFFIISTFTLCLSASHRKFDYTAAQFREFYLRRLFRILPLYLVSIPIAWFRDLVVYDYARPLPQTLASSVSIFIPNNYQGLVWASWTLNVELSFYLLFPLIFSICNSLQRSLVGLAVSVFADITASAHMASRTAAQVPLSFKESHIQSLSILESDIRFSMLHNMQFFYAGHSFVLSIS